MKKIFAVILAFSLLFSNAGLALSTHFCGGMPVDYQFSFGLADLGCGMEKSLAACGAAPEALEKLSKTPCCQNSYQLLQLEEASEKSHFSISKKIIQGNIAVPKALSIDFFVTPEVRLCSFAHYYPPRLLRDIRVLFQVFRI